MTIDMKNYAGAPQTPDAVEQQSLNSYERNEHEFPVLPPEAQENLSESYETESLQQPEQIESPQENEQALNFKALSDSVERLKAEREAEKREYQLQLDMLRANLSRNQQSDAPKAKKMFEGMDENDVPNVGELRKAWSERESAYNEKIEELQVANMHPDYAEVLGKFGKHLAETDPLFIQGIRGAENKALFAYQYAKREQRLQELEATMRTNSQPAPSQKSVNAQRIVENARKPGTLSQAGGQSALSKADYYATMSDQEFMKMASKYMDSV